MPQSSFSKKKYFNLIGFIVLVLIVGFITYLTFWSGENKQRAQFEKTNQDLKEKQQSYPASDIANPKISPAIENEENLSTDPYEDKLYLVSKVIDGDTFKLSTGESVRLIGIDSTELGQAYSDEAKNYLANLIEGREVLLEKDVSEYDKYNRLLRYVYLPIDNNNYLFVNVEMISSGCAYAWSYPPDIKYASDFLKAQDEAQQNNIGLWE